MATEILYRRPWMAPYQLKGLFGRNRISVIEGSTKSGKTAPALCWLAEQAMGCKRGQSVVWVAPVYKQAEMAFRRMKNALPPGLFRAHESDQYIELVNGARIWFRSAEKPDNLYGDDNYAAVFDEASRGREDSWFALRSTLTATQGPIRIIGNVKGRKNWAFRMARLAEAEQASGNPDYVQLRVTAVDAVEAGLIKAEEVEAARRVLPEAVFRELYMAEASDDEGNPFGYKAIRDCIRPLSTRPPVVWGWDLAKSLDWTVGIALDDDGEVCRFERFQRMPWQFIMDRITTATGDTPALVDSTGVGDAILDQLQTKGDHYEGYKFTAPSKQQLMEGLALAIQTQMVGYPEGVIVSELETFEYAYSRTGVRYSAPEGFHDDAVMALALAVENFNRPRTSLGVSVEFRGFY